MRVLNATGVIVHTNLGRAPLARAAAARPSRGRRRATRNLELDLAGGRRGSRHAHVERLLVDLTGAEAAIVVNNGAGAVLLAAAALAGPGPPDHRLARSARRDRRRLPDPGRDRRSRARHWSRSARPTARGWPTTSGRSRTTPAPRRSILRVHPSNFRSARVRRGRSRRGAVWARRAGHRRRRLGRARAAGCRDSGARRRARGRALGRGGRGARLLLGRQASRRTAGRAPRRPRRCGRRGPSASPRPRAADRQALARRARGDARALPRPGSALGARSRCSRCSTPATVCSPPAPSGCARVSVPRARDRRLGRQGRRRRAAAARARRARWSRC